MEDLNRFETSMLLDSETDFKLVSDISDIESPSIQQCLEKSSTESANAQKTNENQQNAVMRPQKSSETFKSVGSSGSSSQLWRRISVKKMFDPLHPMDQTENNDSECCDDVFMNTYETTTENCDVVSPKEVVNKNVSNIHTQEPLILLESPKKLAISLIPKGLFSENTESVKKYTEQEFRQTLKAQGLSLREEFSQKHSKCEAHFARKHQILDRELSKTVNGNKSYNLIISELLAIAEKKKISNEEMESKLEELNVENKKLKVDIVTSKEDTCNLENAFTEIYRRYETSKSMNKTYKENEECLKRKIEYMTTALDEKRSMIEMLDSRTQDVMDKANTEIESAKKSAETQIMVLEAQLKKFQIKIGTLEKDLQQSRSNSDKLGSIYDDLMEKFND